MSTVFLLDGTALAYRSHFALQRSGLTTPEGLPCSATYGFTMTLRRILEQETPDRIAVAFDPPGPTFRHKQFAAYKATREKMPEDMIAQQPWLREVVRAHGVPIFEVPGFEADDVIGTLTRAAEAAGHEVRIVTGDKDFMQLVSEDVKLYNVFKRDIDLVIEGVEAVDEKFGTTPDHVIDVLAIMGDASDNIPGVKGIGEKGATKLIAQFGSVAGVLEHVAEVKGKAREYIERDREQLLLSLELVTIDTQVPLDAPFDSIGPARPDAVALTELFTRLGFISLLKKVEPVAQAAEQRDYVTIADEAQLDAMIDELTRAGVFAFDTETTSLFPLEADLVGLSFSAADLRAFYVPMNATPPVLAAGPEALLERLRPLLTDPALKRVGQNFKYDALVLAGQGVEVPPPHFDTMIASFCIAGAMRRHGLDDLALRYFDLKKIPTTDIIGRGAKQVTMAEVAVETVAEYACEDADVTWRLYGALRAELEENSAKDLFEQLELPLVSVLIAMERRGIRLDTELLEEFGKELEGEIEARVARFGELAGREVNLNSPKALGELFFEELRIQDEAGVKRPKRTKTGWSTDFETLSSRYADVEIVSELLAYREVQKLKSTYVDALPRYVNPKTGRIHCSFSQVAAATGRLASSDPNLQNIPVRTERGRRLRSAFVARPTDDKGEWVLLAADYSQVELRIMAHLAGDELMRKAFAEGRDIHASTAAIIFDVDEAFVTREMRSRAKAVNFGLLYGMGAARLARETGLTMVEARRFMERYFASFPRVEAWREQILEDARANGYVETLLGRRRLMPDINSDAPRMRSMAENAAVNTPVQGSAADIIKKAMIELEARLEASDLAGRMLLQVHDELVLEVPLAELDETREMVREAMEGAVELSVPLRVDFGHGRTWLEAH